MTAATSTTTSTESRPKKAKAWDDPENYRMSIGEHLEELRYRIILGLGAFIVAFLVLFYFGDVVAAYFTKPLLEGLREHGLPYHVYDREIGNSFMVSLQMSLITAGAVSGPWFLYQLWLFVAAGLYPHERKWITRYAPLSIILMIAGMLFVYFVVLPFTIDFFLDWTMQMKLPQIVKNEILTNPTTMPATFPILPGDPAPSLLDSGQLHLWFNQRTGSVNVFVNGTVRSLELAPTSLVVAQYELRDYISLVVMLLLVFGIAFQLPLVVAALLKIGIVDADQLRAGRKMVYFVLLIAAAVVTPGDVVTATLALMLPLMLLYEFGIVLGSWGGKVEEQPEP